MRVGDLIIGVRELIPDLPRTLPPLSTSLFDIFADNIGGFSPPISAMPTGTYSVVVTAVNRWGETQPSSPVTVIVAAGQTILCNYALGLSQSSLPFGTTGIKLYWALQGQPYLQFVLSLSLALPASNVVWVNGIFPTQPGTPATRATAFYPDSDGPRFSAYTLYRWLNEALVTASSLANGIQDMSGIPAVASQGQYYIPGNWKKVWDLWFNGFPVALAGAKDMFYRNVLTGISFLAIVQYNAERMVLELQPQPNQTGGSTTLASPVAVGDTTITVVSTAGIILALGMLQVGSEIMAYSNVSGNQFNGISRGMGGTVESAWPAGTPVNECNIRFTGQRLFTTPFTVGQSASAINVPPEWQMPLQDYMLNKANQGEQSSAEYQSKIKQFSDFIKASCKNNTQVAGPRQVGGTSMPGDSYPTAGGWGVIVP